MKRLIIYPLTYLILIFIEGCGTLGSAFDFKSYTFIGYFGQVLLLLMATGLAELWTRDWMKTPKT